MSTNITKVSVIGTGVIGAGWIIRAIAHNKKVTAFDKDQKQEKKLIKEIKRTWPFVKKLFNKKKLNLGNFKFVKSCNFLKLVISGKFSEFSFEDRLLPN